MVELQQNTSNLKIAFFYIKENKNIKGINTFNSIFLYYVYADDTTFFVSDEDSVIEIMNAFDKFLLLFSLKPNKVKCEILALSLCGMDCILGIHFSCDRKLETEENFVRNVRKRAEVLKLWRMWNLTAEGKITIFKTIATSKIMHLSLVTNDPMKIINELNKIQKEFIWNGNNSKIKHSTLCNKYENGGLKKVDILSKGISSQYS